MLLIIYIVGYFYFYGTVNMPLINMFWPADYALPGRTSVHGDPLFSGNLWLGIQYYFLSRLLTFCRSLLMKYCNMIFFGAEAADTPEMTENDLFHDVQNLLKPPHKFLFQSRGYPVPTQMRLDIAFDSGLCDDMYHSVGAQGTLDLVMLTDFLFFVPLSATYAILYEYETLHFGPFPPAMGMMFGQEPPHYLNKEL